MSNDNIKKVQNIYVLYKMIKDYADKKKYLLINLLKN